MGGEFLRVQDQGWGERFGPQGLFGLISSSSVLTDQITFRGFKKLMFGYIVIIFLFLVLLYLNSSSESFALKRQR